MNSISAILPEFQPAQYTHNYDKKLDIGDPGPTSLTADEWTTIYDRTESPEVKKIYIHNTGIVPVRYLLNQSDGDNDDLFHDVLAADTVLNTGLGSTIDFDLEKVNISKISVWADGGDGQVNVIKYMDEVKFGVDPVNQLQN